MQFKILILKLILLKHAIGYNILQSQISFKYDIEANIELVPDVLNNNADAITKWNLENTSLKVQRVNDDTINMQIMIENDKEELKPLLMPFKLISLNESSKFLMQHPQKALVLYKDEPIWSANIKRAIVSLFQIEGNSENGAFVSNEFGLSGLCPTEYFVVNLTDSLYISKLYDIDRCSIPGGIFHIRSNIPLNYCEIDKNKAVHAVTSRLGNYVLTKLPNSQYLLKSIYAESKSNVLATESYYPQFIFSKVNINFASQELLTDENQIKFNESEKMVLSDFTYVVPLEATGGRNVKSSEQIIEKVIEMLKELAQYLQDKNLNFDDPYLESISEIFRLLETMNYESLKKLYDQLDIGTSYSQEMCKNIFLEILPRVGNSATILLTKYLVMETKVRSTIAVQLLTALPFFVSELSADLVKECEVFLHIVDRPDVRHTAVLSYSTLIYKAYVARIITSTQFERYVKMIFDLFLNSFDYEQQMLYLEAMGNLQLGNVNKYLQPIIQADYSQTTDIRFLAIFATMPTAHTRSAEIFETYWPIFNTKSTPLQLRIAAFTMLLVSAETPGRILGLFNVIKKENCPHMINFYRTTILSISESTYSCLAHLKRLVLYMRRHLPPAPPKKYWITGNYIFDYKDRKFQIGSMLQLLMIGDRKNNLPLIAFIKFDTEAMGRFTGQLGLYIKARGLNDAVLDRLNTINAETLKVDELTKILRMMKIQPMLSTPLHLEIIIQYEGKTILSYYLNQTTFHNLTDGNIINRINAILHTDSHINMQLIRRPFVIKHNFPTLLGTPAAILIENTMIASIRGSTSTLQNNAMEQIIRNNQVDLRYSSYAVAKINSYDPIRDIEFSTIREQGFLVYLPLNNEMKLNLLQKFLSLSFYRKETLTSGLALKSRTRSFSGSKEISKKRSDIPTHYFNIEDIGLNFLIGHNVESSKENLMFLFESDVATSATKTPFSFVQNVLTFTSMIQLTSVHIARDKHFIILLTNEPQSKVVINLKYDLEDLHAMAKEERVVKIDCNLLHILNYDNTHSKQLHKWELSTKYTTFKNKASQAINMSFNRESSVGDKWKVS
ncbi:hypothetical protein PVAND_009193 [Polypedilum vanderplanki]|uniref:Vitellogenin domain-containing protein n=1 Tax=Polypedilum vanderplanki TaxID=319348 RepID=A0A9J6CD08_POLVA|nr:hypothetical protein PVAND_009193 [Polypedilum vanderplanki]